MPRFAYSAYDASGSLTSGEIQAETDKAALAQLSSRGLTPVSLDVGQSALPWWQREITLGAKVHINPQALAFFFRSFASLISVGISLPRALKFCATSTRDPSLKDALNKATDLVGDGETLANSLRSTNEAFPERLIIMVEIGEASNRLNEVASRIATSLESEMIRRREIRSSLIYPSLLLLMSLLVLGLLIFYLAPTLTPVFDTAVSEPPWVLRTMSDLRNAFLSNWPLIIAGTLLALLLVRFSWNKVAQKVTPIFLKLPVIGRYLQQAETLKFFQTLTLMLSSGATLPKALRIAKETASHPAYVTLISQAESAVVAGENLSASIAGSPLFSPMEAAMLEAAEEADEMVPTLDKLVMDLSDRTSRTLDQAVKLITPLMTLIIGLGIGGVILSTISAILSLNDVAF